MDFGRRHIRTAGKGSGSVELTLPTSLRRLVGVSCRVHLNDGEQPAIVLQPELSAARDNFVRIWCSLSSALLGEYSSDFTAARFEFGLMPKQGVRSAPYLCWEDGLALSAAAPASAPLGRVVAACTESLADELGIASFMADAFGIACGFLSCGHIVSPDWQEACDITAMQLASHTGWSPGAALRASPDINSDPFWALLTPGLTATAEFFIAMSQPGSGYPALHSAWRRGRSIELNGG